MGQTNDIVVNVKGTLRNRGRRIDYDAMANGRHPVTNNIEQEEGLDTSIRGKTAELKEAKKELCRSEKKLVLLQVRLGPLSEDDIKYAKSKVECAFVKSSKIFDEDIEVVRTNNALSDFKVFDILFLRT